MNVHKYRMCKRYILFYINFNIIFVYIIITWVIIYIGPTYPECGNELCETQYCSVNGESNMNLNITNNVSNTPTTSNNTISFIYLHLIDVIIFFRNPFFTAPAIFIVILWLLSLFFP
eukprot:474572_1